MTIECPQCKTKYRLPDDKMKANAKFRCSVCKNVFTLEKPAAQDSTEEEQSSESFSAMESNLSFSGLSADKPLDDATTHQVAEPKNSRQEDQMEPVADAALSLSAKDEKLQSPDMLAIESPKKSSQGRWFFYLLLLGAFCGCFYWAWIRTPYLDSIKPWIYENAPAKLFEIFPQLKQPEPARTVSYNLLELKDVRQYQVMNRTLGMLLVIEGKVKNNFTDPCDMIQLEATLFDQEGKVLVSRRQVAGSFASSKQLEELNREELDKIINNKVSIINNNFNVRFGDETPFTILFDNVPKDATDYKVRIIDASIVSGKGNLAQ